jgi:hypothetical protein
VKVLSSNPSTTKKNLEPKPSKLRYSAFLFKDMVSKEQTPAILTGHLLYDPNLRERGKNIYKSLNLTLKP